MLLSIKPSYTNKQSKNLVTLISLQLVGTTPNPADSRTAHMQDFLELVSNLNQILVLRKLANFHLKLHSKLTARMAFLMQIVWKKKTNRSRNKSAFRNWEELRVQGLRVKHQLPLQTTDRLFDAKYKESRWEAVRGMDGGDY